VTLAARRSGKLLFRVSDASGSAMVGISVSAGRKVFFYKTLSGSVAAGTTYVVRWTPPKRGRYAMCVAAHDAAGNKSGRSCATVTVR
jgi:hypothetical protein